MLFFYFIYYFLLLFNWLFFLCLAFWSHIFTVYKYLYSIIYITIFANFIDFGTGILISSTMAHRLPLRSLALELWWFLGSVLVDSVISRIWDTPWDIGHQGHPYVEETKQTILIDLKFFFLIFLPQHEDIYETKAKYNILSSFTPIKYTLILKNSRAKTPPLVYIQQIMRNFLFSADYEKSIHFN